MIRIKLAGAPFNEENPDNPDWPTVHCDGFLISAAGILTNPPALIQLVSNGRIKQPLPNWSEGDVATLTPALGCFWNDVGNSGRCYLDLHLTITCEDREGSLENMVPANPHFPDFTE